MNAFKAASARAVATLTGTLVLVCVASSQATDLSGLSKHTRDTFMQWLEKHRDAEPDFKPGDVLTAKDLDRIRPFVPPGYVELLDFPEFRMEIIPHQDHTPRKDYMECTEKHQAQVTLADNRALENYICGQPFSNADLSGDEPELSGLKAAWNFDRRWQHYGLLGLNFVAKWVRFPGSHSAPLSIDSPPSSWVLGVDYESELPHDSEQLKKIYSGGGAFQRSLDTFYRRVYFTGLAQHEAQGGVLPASGAKEFHWKEFTGFFNPFDIRGTAFIIYRYANPLRADDSWAYIPNLRRVRRISVETKSDSLLGTDHTIEDFYGFSGRVLEWDWKFLGWKKVLAVHDSKYDYSHFYGPTGMVPDDAWSVRNFAIVERTPKSPRHPYTNVILMWDAQNWDTWLMFAWDRKGQLWKVWEFRKKWTETYKEFAEINHGKKATNFQSIQVFDVQNQRGTLWAGFGTGFPDVEPGTVQQLYDISRLEELHR